MPIYEYKCQDCGHTFEKSQSMKDIPLEECPKCRGKVECLIGGGAGVSRVRAFMRPIIPRAILRLVGETDLVAAAIHPVNRDTRTADDSCDRRTAKKFGGSRGKTRCL